MPYNLVRPRRERHDAGFLAGSPGASVVETNVEQRAGERGHGVTCDSEQP